MTNCRRQKNLSRWLPAAFYAALVLIGRVWNATAENRFLLVIETSAAEKSKVNAIQDAVEQIVSTHADGQMRLGDSIGLWTFNEHLNTGQFPLQTWTGDNDKAILAALKDFLKKQPFENTGHLGEALGGISVLSSRSDSLVIFLISSGDGAAQGTAYDDEINAAWRQNLASMKNNRMPIVTVLEAQGGKMINYAVNALPWPIVVPPLPLQRTPVAAVATNLTVATASSGGAASASANAAADGAIYRSNALPAVVVASQPAKPAVPIQSNTIARPLTTNVAVAPVVVPKTNATAPPYPSNPPPKTEMVIAKAPEPKPAQTAPPVVRPEPPKIETVPPAVVAPQISAAPVVTAAVAPKTSGGAAAPPYQSNSPPAEAAALPPARENNRNLFLICGAGFLTAAAGVVFLIVRRARPSSGGRASLITQSMDRKEPGDRK